MRNTHLKLLSASVLAIILTACGGGSDGVSKFNPSGNTGDNPSNPSTPSNSGDTGASKFTQTATWTIDSKTPGAVCFDFDNKTAVDCTGTAWDLKQDNQPRSKKLWTNGGTSGTGKGAAYARLQDWSTLKTYTNATKTPGSNRDISRYYYADSTSSIFEDESWYQYNLQGKHQIYPNYKVYLITTDSSSTSITGSPQSPVYAMQIVNYYNQAGTSGNVTLRWIDTSMPTQVKSKTFAATSSSEWVYVDLATGEVSSKEGNWQVALKRTNVKLNGGDSGSGSAAGFLAKKPAGFYDANGKPVVEKFAANNLNSTQTDLTNTNNYSIPTAGVVWVKDSFSSALNPSYTGTYPNLDYGWYTYSGVTHQLAAKAEADAKGALIRSGDGNSYARVRLAQINNDTGAWVYKFDIQPAPAK